MGLHCLALALTMCQQPVRIEPFERFADRSGAIVLAKSAPELPNVRLHVFASFRGALETPETHGHRHLLEHVLVRQDGRFDLDLEAAGWFLNASTYRDCIEIRATGPASGLDGASRSLGQMLAVRTFDPKHLSRETTIIEQELAARTPSSTVLAQNWATLCGTEGLDPMGTVAAIKAATAEQLSKVYRETFAADQLVIVVMGPVSVETIRATAQNIASQAPPTRKVEFAKRRGATDKWTIKSDGTHVTFSVGVDRYSSSQTAQTLALLYAKFGDNDGATITYVPSLQPGVASVEFIADSFDPVAAFGRLSDQQLELGRQRLREQLVWQLSDPALAAMARGYLQSQAIGAKPETMLEAIDGVTIDGIRGRLAAWKPIGEAKP